MRGYASSEIIVDHYFGLEPPDQIWMDEVDCIGFETSLADCNFNRAGHDCHHNEDVGLHCSGEFLSVSLRTTYYQYTKNITSIFLKKKPSVSLETLKRYFRQYYMHIDVCSKLKLSNQILLGCRFKCKGSFSCLR